MLNFLPAFPYFHGSPNQLECEYVSTSSNLIHPSAKGNKFFIIHVYHGSSAGKLTYLGACPGTSGLSKTHNIALHYSKLHRFVLR